MKQWLNQLLFLFFAILADIGKIPVGMKEFEPGAL